MAANETIEVVPPDPRRLIEGLRDTGYEFNTAVADLVDNSIAAKAKDIRIRITMDYAGVIGVSIADNGKGMDRKALKQAMKYGSPPRRDRRSLGKFGLGLKTASTAFCRRLSVISRPSAKGQISKATWDLDHVANVSRWELLFSEPDEEEIEALNEVAEGSSGTLVKWAKVDRLLGDFSNPGGRPAQNALEKKRISLGEHLSMVYQRFLNKADKREHQKIRIWVDETEIRFWDPFCEKVSDRVADEIVPVGPEDSKVITGKFRVRAFILPRAEEFPNLDDSRRAKIGNEHQGFYIYRENRLIHGPDWLGMFSKEPHGSLLRIEFSFQAELDELLQVDIKKSKISLEEQTYDWLKDTFLPAPRRAADDRYRKGQRSKAGKLAKGAHDPSNKAIGTKEKDVEQAELEVVNRSKGEVQVKNPYGTAHLKLKVGTAHRPGEVYVQPVNSIDDGLLWQPAYIEGHQAVQINSGHEFYRKVYLPNIMSAGGSGVTVQGIDYLIWALGVAELRAVTDATKAHFSEMRFEIGRTLRTLVEGLPEPPDISEASGDK